MTAKVKYVPGVGLMLRKRDGGWVGESGRDYPNPEDMFAGVRDVAPVILPDPVVVEAGNADPYETVSRIARRCGHNATPERLGAALLEETEPGT